MSSSVNNSFWTLQRDEEEKEKKEEEEEEHETDSYSNIYSVDV
jgi:hypothetical protein